MGLQPRKQVLRGWRQGGDLITSRPNRDFCPMAQLFLSDAGRPEVRCSVFRQTAHAVIGGEIPPLSFPASVAALLVSALLSGRSECRRAALPWVDASPRSQKNVLAI
jgi:hypothetical protein